MQPHGSAEDMRTGLVVEDEPLTRLVLIDALEDAGFSVVEASTADEALGILNDRSIHLLFTDIQMPGKISGLDLARVVADRFPRDGILIAFGRLTLADIELPPSAEFFAKPYNLGEVIDHLGQL